MIKIITYKPLDSYPTVCYQHED